eukprot:GHVU01042163.1.p1 GENE.GHVU01042163.1~~GHVU01042163.1.p1  ORF type:complete len:124 (+),score=24.49 GHVU01042163.1:256-627(+)
MHILDMKAPKATIVFDFLNRILKNKRNTATDYSTTRMRSIWGTTLNILERHELTVIDENWTAKHQQESGLGATAKVATGGKAISPKEIQAYLNIINKAAATLQWSQLLDQGRLVGYYDNTNYH